MSDEHASEYIVAEYELEFSPKVRDDTARERMQSLFHNLPHRIPGTMIPEIAEHLERHINIHNIKCENVDIPHETFVFPFAMSFGDGRSKLCMHSIDVSSSHMTVREFKRIIYDTFHIDPTQHRLFIGELNARCTEMYRLFTDAHDMSTICPVRGAITTVFVAPAQANHYCLLTVRSHTSDDIYCPPVIIGLERQPDTLSFTSTTERDILKTVVLRPYCSPSHASFDGAYIATYQGMTSISNTPIQIFHIRVCRNDAERHGFVSIKNSDIQTNTICPHKITRSIWKAAHLLVQERRQTSSTWFQIRNKYLSWGNARGYQFDRNSSIYSITQTSEQSMTIRLYRNRMSMFYAPCMYDPTHEIVCEFSKLICKGFPTHKTDMQILDYISSLTHTTCSEIVQQPSCITTTMRGQQLQTLSFMIHQEKDTSSIMDNIFTKLPIGYYFPGHGLFPNNAPPMDSRLKGGMVCDAMGLGKSLESIALILSNPAPQDAACRATLILCPTALMSQWKSEIEKHSGNTLQVCLCHGRIKDTIPTDELCKMDVVIMSYPTWVSCTVSDIEYRTRYEEITWHRVIFDESHTMSLSVAERTPRSDRRWVLTATPLKNFARQIFALGIRHICPPNALRIELDKMFYFFLRLGIRHTLTDSDISVPILTTTLHKVSLSDEEMKLYEDIAQIIRECKNTHNNVAIMNILNNLRSVCAGGTYDILRLKSIPSPKSPSVDESLVAPTDDICAICTDMYLNPVQTTCGHWFCRECLTSSFRYNKQCPMCRHSLTERSLRYGVTAEYLDMKKRKAMEDGENGESSSKPSILMPCMTKIHTTIQFINDIKRRDPNAKIIVFSAFIPALEDITDTLASTTQFSVQCISGTTDPKKRASIIDRFQSPLSDIDVLCLTMRTASSGLNLTAANHVIFADMPLNPEQLQQAIGRIHRYGQTKHVFAYHIIASHTIEECIYDYMNKKRTRPTQQQLIEFLM